MDSKATEFEVMSIKAEPGTGAGPTARLSSFKPPRDLMLINNTITKQTAKKVFTPNLNVTRNKNKSHLIIDQKKDKKRSEQLNGRDGRRANAQTRNSNIVKSSGVFSEGVAATSAQNRRSKDSYARGSSKEPVATLNKPVYKKPPKIDKEFEDLKIKEYSSDDDETETDAKFLPIRLPMEVDDDGYLYRSEAAIKPPIKQEPIVKTEPIDNVVPDVTVKPEAEDTKDGKNIFDNTKSSLFLFQFPDCLPGRGPDEPDKSTNDDDTKTKNENACRLEHLPEGQVGKIVLYKSGKMKLKMGNTLYDLALGSQTSFRQDIMSVSMNPEDRTGTMINLGPFLHKIVAIPDWEHLIKESGL